VSATGPRAGRAGFLEDELREALAEPNLRVLATDTVGGGCIHHALRLRTTHGEWFAKWSEDCAPDLFPSEAAGLRALRAAGSELRIPEVLLARPPLGARPACIVMEYLPPGDGAARDNVALGRGLATVHSRPAAAFGFEVTTYCGPTAQDNRATTTWPEFYGERRLRPMLARLAEERRIGHEEQGLLERLVERLPRLLAHEPSPALVHGDLWSGNVLRTALGPALVDPACAVCDPEMEFGITTLFGGFSDRFFEAYLEAHPLPSGWRERNPLYQLYHLLNHHLIFGGHYGREALAIARRFA
jgi:fructosamine-3-kinase